MPLTPSFSVSQTVGSPSVINITDTSTGSDPLVTSRRVYLQDYAGNYVVPSGVTTNYVPWPLASPTLAIDCLTQDMALDVTVEWLNVSNTVLYTDTSLEGFTLYNETFYYSLTQAQAMVSNPTLFAQDTNYYNNKMKLRLFIDSGNQAISIGNDITSAQICYDQASYMVSYQQNYF